MLVSNCRHSNTSPLSSQIELDDATVIPLTDIKFTEADMSKITSGLRAGNSVQLTGVQVTFPVADTTVCSKISSE